MLTSVADGQRSAATTSDACLLVMGVRLSHSDARFAMKPLRDGGSAVMQAIIDP